MLVVTHQTPRDATNFYLVQDEETKKYFVFRHKTGTEAIDCMNALLITWDRDPLERPRDLGTNFVNAVELTMFMKGRWTIGDVKFEENDCVQICRNGKWHDYSSIKNIAELRHGVRLVRGDVFGGHPPLRYRIIRGSIVVADYKKL